MKATKMVYALITILILIPIFIKRIKKMMISIKSNQRDIFSRQFLYLILAVAIVFGFTISLYRFTIAYKAPLFVERVNEVLVEAGREGLNESEFKELLGGKNMASENIDIIGYDVVLDSIDFKKEYKAYLSERSYSKEDSEKIYCKYIQGEETIYIEIDLNSYDNKWEVSALTVLAEEVLEKVDPKMKFLIIK